MGGLVEGWKGSEDEFAFRGGKVKEEGVNNVAAFTETFPSAPGSVPVFIRLRFHCIMDDSVVCSTCVTKDKISSGRGQILKFSGMSCGTKR